METLWFCTVSHLSTEQASDCLFPQALDVCVLQEPASWKTEWNCHIYSGRCHWCPLAQIIIQWLDAGCAPEFPGLRLVWAGFGPRRLYSNAEVRSVTLNGTFYVQWATGNDCGQGLLFLRNTDITWVASSRRLRLGVLGILAIWKSFWGTWTVGFVTQSNWESQLSWAGDK